MSMSGSRIAPTMYEMSPSSRSHSILHVGNEDRKLLVERDRGNYNSSSWRSRWCAKCSADSDAFRDDDEAGGRAGAPSLHRCLYLEWRACTGSRPTGLAALQYALSDNLWSGCSRERNQGRIMCPIFTPHLAPLRANGMSLCFLVMNMQLTIAMGNCRHATTNTRVSMQYRLAFMPAE